LAETGSPQLNISSCIFCGLSQITATQPSKTLKRKTNTIGGKLIVEGTHAEETIITESVVSSPLWIKCENCGWEYILYGLDRKQDKEFAKIVLQNTKYFDDKIEQEEIISSLNSLKIRKGIEMVENLKGIAAMGGNPEERLYLVFEKFYLVFTRKHNNDKQLIYYIRSVFPTSRSLNGGEFL
jgi:hypothetical protein